MLVLRRIMPCDVHVPRSGELYRLMPSDRPLSCLKLSPTHHQAPFSYQMPPPWAWMLLPSVSSHVVPEVMTVLSAPPWATLA